MLVKFSQIQNQNVYKILFQKGEPRTSINVYKTNGGQLRCAKPQLAALALLFDQNKKI